ncbi:hypothetical protein SAMN04490183_3222 [Pseudomonas corrugata]|nr:hypothetical protein SAMN04490183_3222 [Pseudomonas corrugata]
MVMARNLSFLLCVRDGEGQAGIASIGDKRFWAIIERQKHLSSTQKPVGASLLAIAACQTTQLCLVLRYREQARSHSGLGCSQIQRLPPSSVGAGLLAKAVGQLASVSNVPTPSRASLRRHVSLGVAQMIELSELLANRALDIVDPR